MYHHPFKAKLGQMSQISVDRCYSLDKSAAIFCSWGAVPPNLPCTCQTIVTFWCSGVRRCFGMGEADMIWQGYAMKPTL